jgi:phage gp36-like protein
MYATAAQLLMRYNSDEIAQRADDGLPRLVTGEMLELAARANTPMPFSDAECAAVNAALAKVERALRDAEQTINTYLGSRYTLPLSPAPEVLERHACQLARFVLFDDAITDQIKELYRDSIKFLEQVATGKVSLGITDKGATPLANVTVSMHSGGSIFGRQSSKGFI